MMTCSGVLCPACRRRIHSAGSGKEHGERRIPLLGKGGVNAPKSRKAAKPPCKGAEGVVGSTTNYRMLHQPPPPRRIFGNVAFFCSARRPPPLPRTGVCLSSASTFQPKDLWVIESGF